MSHRDALLQLIPVALAGVFYDDLTVEGAELDLLQADIEAERLAIITDTATLMPLADDRIKLSPIRWDIKKPFYVAIAANMGYAIRIEDYTPSMSNWLCAGDELIDGEPWIDFSSGVGQAGDTLSQEDTVLPWIWQVIVISSPDTPPTPGLETVLVDLKPAHLQLNFTYL